VGGAPCTRAELVRRFVLNAICDDYENVGVSIAAEVFATGRRCGLEIDRQELSQALRELIEMGWAKAYYLRQHGIDEIAGMPPVEQIEDFDGPWFYRTDEGLRVQLADWAPWPFDDENALRKSWTAPES
jgi:hypothetical protein